MTELPFDNPAVVALDVTIGLAVIYLGLSVVASATLEVIANLRRSRAAYLRLALQRMLDGSTDSGAVAHRSDTTNRVLSHPLIANLSQPIGPFSQFLFRAKDGPAYLSSERFAEALLDILKTDSGRENINAAIDALPHDRLKVALSALRSQSSGDTEFVLRLRSWYDELMERAAGWYKRSAQVSLFAIGLVIAVTFNIDTVQYSGRIACDGVLRALLVDDAAGIATSDVSASAGLPRITANNQGVFFGNAPNARVGCPSIFASAPGASRSSCVAGESNVNGPETCEPLSDERSLNNLLGWLLTAFAVSLGAPYWLRLLGMLVALRSSLPIGIPQPTEPRSNGTGWGRGGPTNGAGDDDVSIAGIPVDDRDMVEDIQMILGFRGTELTGKLDARTSRAIALWQRNRGMNETGSLTLDLYDLMLQIPASAKPRLA